MNQLETIWQDLHWSQGSWLSPNSSCSTAYRERLISFLQVSYLRCLCLAHGQKTSCCMWPLAKNLPTQRRGPQVGAMYLSLTKGVPLCQLVKPTLKKKPCS